MHQPKNFNLHSKRPKELEHSICGGGGGAEDGFPHARLSDLWNPMQTLLSYKSCLSCSLFMASSKCGPPPKKNKCIKLR